ncbi:hypothetical protein ZIOFF_043512 [Zingiber officinale]|uniref:Uncharacterized protein n=1 Tax=Zingiber officinale TaxID=94328 RepID=A0A8J5KZL6_ZINOF|nr:hypothetical protein ZIOFF_043512 [Zingiber officinale]
MILQQIMVPLGAISTSKKCALHAIPTSRRVDQKPLVSLTHLSSDRIPPELFSQLLISRRPSPSNSSSHTLSFQLLSGKHLSGEPLSANHSSELLSIKTAGKMFSPYSFTSSCPNLFASDPSPHSHFLHRSRKRERAHQRKGSRRKASGREGKNAHAIPTKESSGKRQVMRFRRRRAWEKGKFSSIIDTDRHSRFGSCGSGMRISVIP